MPPAMRARPKGGVPRSHRLLPFASAPTALATSSAVGALAPAARRSAARAAASFTFTVAGDYAQTHYTSANLAAIKASGAAFNLALGDFSYAATITGSVAQSATRIS